MLISHAWQTAGTTLPLTKWAIPADNRAMIKLQAQTLERIRNHFREMGQPASIHFMASASTSDDPFATDPEAKARFEALFEAMFLMVSSDGNIEDREFEVIRGAVRGLTDNGVRTTYIDKLIAECQARTAQGRQNRVLAIAPILKQDSVLVEAAFSLSAACAFADDKIGEEENQLINEFADSLGLSAERAEELLDQLQHESLH